MLVYLSCISASWAGPLDKTWDNNTCTQLGRELNIPEYCESACNENQQCNAFNYHSEPDIGCWMLDCPIEIPPPATYLDGWEGYYYVEESGEETWRRCLSWLRLKTKQCRLREAMSQVRFELIFSLGFQVHGLNRSTGCGTLCNAKT